METSKNIPIDQQETPEQPIMQIVDTFSVENATVAHTLSQITLLDDDEYPLIFFNIDTRLCHLNLLVQFQETFSDIVLETLSECLIEQGLSISEEDSERLAIKVKEEWRTSNLQNMKPAPLSGGFIKEGRYYSHDIDPKLPLSDYAWQFNTASGVLYLNVNDGALRQYWTNNYEDVFLPHYYLFLQEIVLELFPDQFEYALVDSVIDKVRRAIAGYYENCLVDYMLNPLDRAAYEYQLIESLSDGYESPNQGVTISGTNAAVSTVPLLSSVLQDPLLSRPCKLVLRWQDSIKDVSILIVVFFNGVEIHRRTIPSGSGGGLVNRHVEIPLNRCQRGTYQVMFIVEGVMTDKFKVAYNVT